jgi:hypothetical protein
MDPSGGDPEPEVRRVKRGDQEYDMRMPQSKDRPRYQPERWAMIQVAESIDVLFDNVVDAALYLEPSALLEHLTPERQDRLAQRLDACVDWLDGLKGELRLRIQVSVEEKTNTKGT